MKYKTFQLRNIKFNKKTIQNDLSESKINIFKIYTSKNLHKKKSNIYIREIVRVSLNLHKTIKTN